MKRALIVGIDAYPRAGDRLQGAAGDARRMKERLFAKHGFDETSTLHLVNGEATRGAILDGLGWLTSGTARGDTCVFYYSGHGSVMPDKDGDEEDGTDECLCPVDFRTAGKIADDELARMYAKAAPGCRLTLIMDCCHAGDIQKANTHVLGYRRLDPTEDEGDAISAATMLYRADRDAFTAPILAAHGGLSASERERLVKEAYQRFAESRVKPVVIANKERCVLVAACPPKLLSAEAVIDGQPQGVLTSHLLAALDQLGPGVSAQSVFETTARLIASAHFLPAPRLEGRPENLALPLF